MLLHLFPSRLSAALSCLSGALMLSMSLSASAAGPAATALAAAKADAAALKARAVAAGALDTTAPKLTAFSLATSVDVQQANPSAIAHIVATDDFSGIARIYVSLRSPSGAQSVVREDVQNSGLKKYSADLGIGAQAFSWPGTYFHRLSEPGEWKVEILFMYDMNGNVAIFNADDLAAFGRTTISVLNSGPYDNIAPILIGGQLGAKKVSLSTPPAGTPAETAPVIAAAVRGFDPGNGMSAGFYSAGIEMCLPDPHSTCKDSFFLDGFADAPGLADTIVRVSGSPRKDQTPGKYRIYAVTFMDLAGNTAFLTGDMSTAFPKGTAIDIQP